MRIAIYILAGLGVAGAAAMGFINLNEANNPQTKKALEGAEKLLEEVENDPSVSPERAEEARSLRSKLKQIFIAIYALIAASLIGIGGMVMVYMGKTFIAAGLLGVPVLLPGVLVPKSLILTFPLVIAGGLCFALEREEPKRKKKKRRSDDDADEAEPEEEDASKKKKKRRRDEEDEDVEADRNKRRREPEKKRRRREEEEEEEEEQPEAEEQEEPADEAEDEVESEAVEEPPAPVMQVTCPHCKSTLKSKNPLPVGKSIKCPKCAKPVRIEAPRK